MLARRGEKGLQARNIEAKTVDAEASQGPLQQGCASLIEVLQRHCQKQGEKCLYTFLDAQGREEQRLTFRQLDQRARAIAVLLAQRGWSGQRLLLLYPPGLDFVAGFLGCLYAGAVAVPAYPPRLGRSARGHSRLRAILDDCRPAALLSSSAFAPRLSRALAGAGLEGLPLLATDSAEESLADAWERPEIDGQTLAFLQYTSGSTSSPKGVMLSHSNLLHNEELIRRAFGQSEHSRVVSWLPLYHDMGLIGGVLQPLYSGSSCLLMPPLAFLQKPVRWLEAISRFRATTSGAPNFAYDLCVRRIAEQQKGTLDLSSWQVAFNGSEPVRASTLKRFSRAFQNCGFRPQAHFPCYGLAEATVFVSGGTVDLEPQVLKLNAAELEGGEAQVANSGRLVVSCGASGDGHQIRIVDPQSGLPCPPGRVGEIWMQGPSVACGYWNRPRQTERSFAARLTGGADQGAFLRSGDLGFLHDGGLYVTGRLKDLIILRGRNLYPQDIELAVERCHSALQPGAGAAFSVEVEDEERLVVVQELQRSGRRADPDEVRQAMRQAVSEEFEVQLFDAVLMQPGGVLRTPSGKVRRQACREEYVRRRQEAAGRNQEEGEQFAVRGSQFAVSQKKNLEPLLLDPTAYSLQPTAIPLRAFLIQAASRVLQISDAPMDCPLTGLGLDSLGAAELQQAVMEGLGVEVSLAGLLEGASMEDLEEEIGRLQEGAGRVEEAVLAAGPSRDEFPLSDGQRALWFLQRLAPQRSADNMAAAVRLRGFLDVAALRSCWQELADRHPSLRTSFAQQDGEPLQKVHPHLRIDFPCHQADGASLADLRTRLAAEAFRPFDLCEAPLLRLALWRLADDDHVLLLSVHHIVADFASLAVLFGELEQLYARATGGPPAELQPLPLSYADYVQWQQSRLEGAQGERLWEYWRQKLAGPLPQLDLPTDRPRPPLLPEQGASQSLQLDAGLVKQLDSLSRQYSSTLFTSLLSGFLLLLHRYSSQDDLLVGTPTAGRADPRLAGLVGYFAAPAVLRASFSGTQSFSDLLRAARSAVAEALQHEYPFIRLAERLHPRREPGRAPLFQVFFSFQQAASAEQQPLAAFALGEEGARQALGSLQIESLAWSERPVQFDLTLMLARWKGGLNASLHYNAALFDGTTAQRMLGHFRSALQAAARQPTQELCSIPLLSSSERFQALQEWNDTARPLSEQCIHHMFESSCQMRPDAVAAALASQGGEVSALSCRELESQSALLSSRLREFGAGAEIAVGVHLERSLEMLVGVLGILRSGSAYLPLDPGFPQARLQMMVVDSRAPLLLSGDPTRWPDGSVDLCPEIGASLCRMSASPDVGAGVPAGPDNLAYLIYTSGSTGRPKGVQVPHRGVVNFLRSMARCPGLSQRDALLSVTTLSFDISALELFMPWMTGARLVLADRNTVSDGALLTATLAACRITALQATPATWRLLLASGWEGASPMRAWCGGEALPTDLARRILQQADGLWNLYGPTETTIWSTVGEFRAKTQRREARAPSWKELGTVPNEKEGSVPIGRPIDNTSIYLLSSARELQPVGVAGELCIGGQGVVRGYWQRSRLTAQRFIPDPFSPQVGARLYRTGDLARRRPDGRLEFLGRLDHQVKLRGFRIELGEIETSLEAHPEVRQAVAALRGERLVGYVQKESGIRNQESGRKESRDSGTYSLQPTAYSLSLSDFLRRSLPDYMIPSLYVQVERLPLTPNGKVDRNALPEPVVERPLTEGGFAAPQSRLEKEIAKVWKSVLEVDRVGLDDNFFDLGGHSLLLAKVHSRLRRSLDDRLTMLDLLRHPTVGSLAKKLVRSSQFAVGSSEKLSDSQTYSLQPTAYSLPSRSLAIIGMAGRFPGASSIERLWERLCSAEECISFFSDEELIAEGIDPALVRDSRYVKAAGVLEDAEEFDAAFFGFTPREAELMDPQHRVFLECAWQALEDSGYDSLRYPGRIGVFAGVGINSYSHQAGLEELQSPAARYQAFIGNDKDFVPTRVSYKLNLRGPSLNVQTACSSSLVAVHLACRSLLEGECDMALAGGVTVRFPQKSGYLYEEGGIPSPDGHCRAFDAKAQGTVFGNGAGIVVLKPQEAAKRDGDRILALLRGTAINNDGSSKLGYTAPSAEGQSQVIAQALRAAGTPAKSISYLECHGTGTPLGDPIEVAALQEAFRSEGEPPRRCLLGSIKTNLGHLDTAAGIAGLIKAALALKQAKIPPSLHFEAPNPEIDFESSPFRVNTELSDWTVEEGPRRAGVSSFGIGGTNAHAVLEEPPPADPSGPSRPWQLLVLSAKTPTALDALSHRLADALRPQADADSWLADAAYTLQVGRRPFEQRRILLTQSAQEALQLLQKHDPERVFSAAAPTSCPPVVFLFPGQGAQYPGMTRQLYESEPVFRGELDRCATLLVEDLELDLREAVWAEWDGEGSRFQVPGSGFQNPESGFPDPEPGARNPKPDPSPLSQTFLAQPALFAVEYALARLWISWRVEPAAMLGHSVGEYVAACLAGVFSLEDALKLVTLRGRLMQTLAAGDMLSVGLAENELAPLLDEPLALAAVNAPSSCVVSGPPEAVAKLEKRLEAQGAPVRRLHTSHAFHSSMMDPILEEFQAQVSRFPRQAPQSPWISNRTGRPITAQQAIDPAYWAEQLRHTVRFADGVKELSSQSDCIFLEVGPGHTLSTLVRQQAAGRTVLNSMRHPRDLQHDGAVLLRALGRLWLAGVEIDWQSFSAPEKRQRVALPTYPFERQRHFLKARRQAAQALESPQEDLSQWFHLPVWQQSPWPEQAPQSKQPSLWLLFADQPGVTRYLARQLKERDEQVVVVEWGQSFQRLSEGRFSIDASRPEDYRELLKSVGQQDVPLRRIVHAWNVTSGKPCSLAEGRLRSFNSLLLLAQALERSGSGQSIQLEVLSNDLHRVAGEKQIQPLKALLQGPVTVLPLEHPQIACRNIDLALPGGDESLDALAQDVLDELLSNAGDTPVAFRHGQRWVRTFVPLPLQPPAGRPQRLRPRGVYLITGGLGGIGLTLARQLAQSAQARLVLTGRSQLPEASRWQEWLNSHPPQEQTCRRIRELQALQRTGAEVLALAADVTDREAMQDVVHQAEERFGALNGVIHAAGLPGQGVASVKKLDEARQVLAPKVEGTLLLHSLLERHSLDFFLICSSITALAGGFGQIEYTAANAFCDAFAHSQSRRRGTWVGAINWDRWEEVGMAARNPSPLGFPLSAATGASLHPLLDSRIVETAQRSVFSTRLQAARHWVLSEHRIAGRPTVPGATYLEMARAAWAALHPKEPPASLWIREAVFLTPLSTPEEGQCEVLTVLEKKEEGFEFKLVSRSGPESWQEHARGRLAALPKSEQRPAPRSLDELRQACSQRSITTRRSSGNGSEEFLVTGPRWQSLKRIEVGEQEALAVLKLDEALASDLESYLLHPALLDIAAGSVQFLAEGDFLPLAYESLRLYALFPEKGFSHIRMRGPLQGREVISCDVSVLDEQGAVCAEIEGFSMKRVGEEALAQLRQSGQQASVPSAAEEASAVKRAPGTPGVPPQQGAEALLRILARGGLPQVVVSPRPPSAAIHEARSWDRTRIVEQLNRIAPTRPVQARPEVSSDFAAPSEGIEERIAAIWQKVLGLERVGVNDNFFELGGNSLSGVQLVSELKQELGLDIPTVSIFEAPTVAALARYLQPDEKQESAVQRGRSRAAKKKQAMQRRQQLRRRA